MPSNETGSPVTTSSRPDAGRPFVPGRMPRRRVLGAVGLVGAAGALAACGSNSTPAATSAAATTDAASPPASPSASDMATASEMASDSASAAGLDLGPASDIPAQGGRVFDDLQVVVTQPEAGTYKGFSAICTHLGCTVSDVSNNQINCRCHGSVFSAEDGSVINGPASAPLAPAEVSVVDGNIIAAMNQGG